MDGGIDVLNVSSGTAQAVAMQQIFTALTPTLLPWAGSLALPRIHELHSYLREGALMSLSGRYPKRSSHFTNWLWGTSPHIIITWAHRAFTSWHKFTAILLTGWDAQRVNGGQALRNRTIHSGHKSSCQSVLYSRTQWANTFLVFSQSSC